MASYLRNVGDIVISTGATPSNLVDLTEANAASVAANASIRFSPFQQGGLNIDYDSLAAEDSGRSVDGYLHIHWILTRARKLEITLPPCSPTFASQVIKRVMGKHYYITYHDTLTNGEKTSYVYTSNGRGSLYSGVLRNGLYQGVSFNAIEIMGETTE